MKQKDYLIINRAKWRTASHGKGLTLLLNNEEFMCCLGFRCFQMGIPKSQLLGSAAPGELRKNWNIPNLINRKGQDTIFTDKAMQINDDPSLTNEERESKIIKHFAKKDIIVEFIGKYKK